jgi:transposase InsO family protein
MAVRVAAMDVRMASALVGAVPNVAAFCRGQGISRQTFYKWRRRFAQEGLPGLQERSRAPHTSPCGCPQRLQDLIVRLRKELLEDGCDHGADSIRWRLLRDPGVPDELVPSRAAIWRLLTARGLIVPEPGKRPRSAGHRFVYPRPNECWQADWTSWPLTDGTPAAIAGVLDDHSRFLAGLQTAPGEGTAALVWSAFLQAVDSCGLPVRSLTDNGLVYSGYRRGTEVTYETNLRALGVTPICSSPYHPQTCGKIERLWQTLKKWLAAREPPATADQLHDLLQQFRTFYNHHRAHRALHGATPAEAFHATPAARPPERPLPAPVFVQTASVTSAGSVRVGPYLVNVGAAWQGHPVHTIRDGTHITIFSGNRLVRELTADPTRTYQPTGPNPDRSRHRHPPPPMPS